MTWFKYIKEILFILQESKKTKLERKGDFLEKQIQFLKEQKEYELVKIFNNIKFQNNNELIFGEIYNKEQILIIDSLVNEVEQLTWEDFNSARMYYDFDYDKKTVKVKMPVFIYVVISIIVISMTMVLVISFWKLIVGRDFFKFCLVLLYVYFCMSILFAFFNDFTSGRKIKRYV